MNKLTVQEIIQRLQTYFEGIGEDVGTFAHHNFLDEDIKALGLGPIEEIDQYGGEGQGDKWWSVKYFPDHDIYLKVTGFYQSHYGTDFYDGWRGVKEVKPKEKTITVYE